jgi:ribosomal protein S18 acetylase RimI-like enzyme
VSAGAPTPTLSSELAGRETAFLAFDAMAMIASNRFVFDSNEDAQRFQAYLFERGVAESCPPAGRLLIVDGEPAGILAVLAPPVLRKRRLGAALAAARDPAWAADTGVRRRLQLIGGTLHRVAEDEAYLARIAVGDHAAGRGLGRWLLGEALAEARHLGLARLVLDVSDDNARAIEFYRRTGFDEIGRVAAEDAETGRRVGYLHLTLPV